MFDLLHSGFGYLAFTLRRAFGLLDEAMKHDDTLANEGAKEHPGDASAPLSRSSNRPSPNAFVWGSPRFGPSATIRRVSTTYRAANVSGNPVIWSCTASL
jgi:hypothetical protein